MKFKNFLLETINDSTVNDNYQKIENIVNVIKQDCSLFLEKSNKLFMWRGILPYSSQVKNLNDDGTFKIGTVRKDREALNSSIILHNILNNYFKSKFGIPFRSESLFVVVGDINIARMFTKHSKDIYAIFPIGDFHYVWSKLIADATNAFQLNWLGYGNPENKKFFDTINKVWKEFIEQINYDEFKKYQTPMDFIIDKSITYKRNKLFTEAYGLWADFIEFFLNKENPWIYDEGLKEALLKYKNHEIMIKCEKYYLVNREIANNIIEKL